MFRGFRSHLKVWAAVLVLPGGRANASEHGHRISFRVASLHSAVWLQYLCLHSYSCLISRAVSPSLPCSFPLSIPSYHHPLSYLFLTSIPTAWYTCAFKDCFGQIELYCSIISWYLPVFQNVRSCSVLYVTDQCAQSFTPIISHRSHSNPLQCTELWGGWKRSLTEEEGLCRICVCGARGNEVTASFQHQVDQETSLTLHHPRETPAPMRYTDHVWSELEWKWTDVSKISMPILVSPAGTLKWILKSMVRVAKRVSEVVRSFVKKCPVRRAASLPRGKRRIEETEPPTDGQWTVRTTHTLTGNLRWFNIQDCN